jgi:tetratricopeptide (TPR) repeat protein
MEAAGDSMALYVGYCAQGDIEEARGRVDAALEAYERAFAHAGRAGYQPSPMVGTLAYLRFAGSTPVTELLAWLDEIDDLAGPDQFVRAYRGWSLAKLGRFDEARAIIAEACTQQAERGGGLLLANLTAFESVGIELLAGDPAAAVAFGREGCRLHEELGTEMSLFLPAAGATLAQALYALDRLEDAETWIGRTLELASSDDVWPAVLGRQVRAKLLARRGENTEAERLAREATVLSDATDSVDRQGDAYADLGEVLLLARKPDEAARALEQALDRYERKGNRVMAQRVRGRLDELRVEPVR